MTADGQLPSEASESMANRPETTAEDATGVGAGIAPRQFVDNSWLRWWPVAAGIAIVLVCIGAVIWWRPDATAIVCTGIIGLLAIVLGWYALEHSIKAITVDAAGLHARHGLGATTHLPWERIADFYGGGRYGLPLILISRDTRMVLHRRLAGWPALYTLVQRARPELWTPLDPQRLTSSVSVLSFVGALLMFYPAIWRLRDGELIFGGTWLALLIVSLARFLFYDPRSIALSDDSLRVKYPLHSRFVPRSDIGGFISVERPYWRRGGEAGAGQWQAVALGGHGLRRGVYDGRVEYLV